jgi:hypothetical protein
MEAQQLWRAEFDSQKTAAAEYKRDMQSIGKEKDEMVRNDLLGRTNDYDPVCYLTAPHCWSVSNTSGDGVVGVAMLPSFRMVMQVDIMGKFTFDTTLVTFQTSLGGLPTRATFELTKMLYKTTTGADNLPKSIFMGKAELLSEFDRSEKFKTKDNTLDAFYAAGCYTQQMTKMLRVLRGIQDPVQKFNLYREYIDCSQHQFKSLVLNGSLHSNHAFHTVKYIDVTEARVCPDLRKLVNHFIPPHCSSSLYADVEDAVFANDFTSRNYWDIMCPSTFVSTTWIAEEMHKKHNEIFWHLTAQNMKIRQDTTLSSIMYRLGQHNGWTYIGMPTVVCDAGAKLKVRVNNNQQISSDTRKRPSAGVDLIREYLDSERKSVRDYLEGGGSLDDDTELCQLKRVTPNSLQVGFVWFVGGKVEKMPDNELARDCVMPEGPPDGFEAMCQLLSTIPRDGENNAELWTTVDKQQNGVRERAYVKLIKGFSLYLVLMAKNFFFEGKTETRYCLLSLYNCRNSNCR